MKKMIFTALLLAGTSVVLAASTPIALTNATIVDPSRGALQSGMTILVEGERIRSVYADGTRRLPRGAVVHDVGGRFVIPGLIESHTHVTPLHVQSPETLERELRRMLAGGVVAAREMGGDYRVVSATVDAIRSGTKAGPDIFHAALMGSAHFMAKDRRAVRASSGFRPGDAPWMQAVTTESDAREVIRRAAGTKARAVKLYIGIEPELIRKLASEAHRQGLRVWSHATVYPSRPIDVVRGGVDVVSHLCGLAWQDRDLEPSEHVLAHVDNRPSFDPEKVEADSAEMTSLFAEMARRGTILDPTLSNHERPGDDGAGCTSSLVVELARAAARAGVLMVTGTDYVTPADDPYPALHREIASLVDNGVLTPAQALVAATQNGARVLGKEDDYGSIAAGKLASLVILEKNPLADIRALRTVVTVMHRGKRIGD